MQELLGHRNVATTQKYIGVNYATARETVEAMALRDEPYRRPLLYNSLNDIDDKTLQCELEETRIQRHQPTRKRDNRRNRQNRIGIAPQFPNRASQCWVYCMSNHSKIRNFKMTIFNTKPNKSTFCVSSKTGCYKSGNRISYRFYRSDAGDSQICGAYRADADTSQIYGRSKGKA